MQEIVAPEDIKVTGGRWRPTQRTVAYVAVDAVPVPEQRAERTAGEKAAPRERRTNVSYWNAQVDTVAPGRRLQLPVRACTRTSR